MGRAPRVPRCSGDRGGRRRRYGTGRARGGDGVGASRPGRHLDGTCGRRRRAAGDRRRSSAGCLDRPGRWRGHGSGGASRADARHMACDAPRCSRRRGRRCCGSGSGRAGLAAGASACRSRRCAGRCRIGISASPTPNESWRGEGCGCSPASRARRSSRSRRRPSWEEAAAQMRARVRLVITAHVRDPGGGGDSRCHPDWRSEQSRWRPDSRPSARRRLPRRGHLGRQRRDLAGAADVAATCRWRRRLVSAWCGWLLA